jgi:outer membrane receptor protein involved in Fe transport
VVLNYFREGLVQEADVVNINFTITVLGARDDVDPVRGFRVNPMYARTDLALSYTFSPGALRLGPLTVFCRVENLFDRDYEEVLGFEAPPLNFLVGVRAALP